MSLGFGTLPLCSVGSNMLPSLTATRGVPRQKLGGAADSSVGRVCHRGRVGAAPSSGSIPAERQRTQNWIRILSYVVSVACLIRLALGPPAAT